MAPRNRTRTATPAPEPETVTNTYGPDAGGNVIAAGFRGLYNIFGARVERWEVTPEGITAHGLTFADGFDADTIISDIYRRGDKTVNPRLDFLSLYPIISGETPAPFTNADQLTAWMVKFMKGGSRSPKYVKDANQAYKEAHGFAVHRGRPKKTFTIKEIGHLDAAALEGVDRAEVEALRATLDSLFVEPETVEA